MLQDLEAWQTLLSDETVEPLYSNELAEFTEDWQGSDLRVTAGRCQSVVENAQLLEELVKVFASVLPGKFVAAMQSLPPSETEAQSCSTHDVLNTCFLN